MTRTQRKKAIEAKTIKVMIEMFCRNLHQTRHTLCTNCQELMDYANVRLEKCPLKDDKTTCDTCKIHCYSPAMKDRVISVMKYAGPRMIFKHPILAMYHVISRLGNGAVR